MMNQIEMAMFNDAMRLEYLIPIILIILIGLPLVPHRKLRYYTCYIGYGIYITFICSMLIPLGILKPRNIRNLKFAASIITLYSKILGIQFINRGEDILRKDRQAVIVANHQSVLDSLGMCSIWDAMNKCTAICKKEVLYYFPLGPLFWLGGLEFINRINPKEAVSKIEDTVRHLKGKKAKLWIYPEGTRNKEGKNLLPFKKGAFTVAICTQAPIIPVVFSPFYFIDHVNKTFSKGKVIISVLEAISTEGLTLDDVDLLTEKTYKLMLDEYEKLQIEIRNLE